MLVNQNSIYDLESFVEEFKDYFLEKIENFKDSNLIFEEIYNYCISLSDLIVADFDSLAESIEIVSEEKFLKDNNYKDFKEYLDDYKSKVVVVGDRVLEDYSGNRVVLVNNENFCYTLYNEC